MEVAELLSGFGIRQKTTFSEQQLRSMAQVVPFWFHSIELGHGVVTEGWKSAERLAREVESMRLPDLRGKSVLDINAWDGFYSFTAERLGASRVVALDKYMWSMELGAHSKYWKECMEQGVTPAPYHTMPYYKPDELPGKVGFDTAQSALGSQVEDVVGDFMEMELEPLGMFDVVLYLGSLYHMENPLQAMKRVAAVTKELAIIETEAALFPKFEHHALCEFFESNELNGDVSNWWAPNEKALVSLCRAAGFKRVEVVLGASPIKPPRKLRSAVGAALRELWPRMKREQVVRYRAMAHAWK